MLKELLLVSCIFLVLVSALAAAEEASPLKVGHVQPQESIPSDPVSNEDDLNTAEYRHRGWGGGYGGWGRGYGGWGRGYGGWGRGYGGWGRGYGGWGRGYGGGYGNGRGWGYY